MCVLACVCSFASVSPGLSLFFHISFSLTAWVFFIQGAGSIWPFCLAINIDQRLSIPSAPRQRPRVHCACPPFFYQTLNKSPNSTLIIWRHYGLTQRSSCMTPCYGWLEYNLLQSSESFWVAGPVVDSLTQLCTHVWMCGRDVKFKNGLFQKMSKTSSGREATSFPHLPLWPLKCLRVWRTAAGLNAIHYYGVTPLTFGVFRCVKCSGLCPIRFVYKLWAVYVWLGGGRRKAGLCVQGFSLGGEWRLWLWLIPADIDPKLHIRRWDVSLTLVSGIDIPESLITSQV